MLVVGGTFLKQAPVKVKSCKYTIKPILKPSNSRYCNGCKSDQQGTDHYIVLGATYDMLYKNGRRNHSASEGTLGEDQMEFDSAVHQLLTPTALKQGSASLAEHCQGQRLEIPQLTREEVHTFTSLTSELDRQRTGAKGESCPFPGGTNVGPEAPVAAKKCPKRPASESREPVKPPQKVTQDMHSGSKTLDQSYSGTSKIGQENEDESSSNTCQNVSPTHGSKETDQIETLVDLMYQRRKGLDYASAALSTRN